MPIILVQYPTSYQFVIVIFILISILLFFPFPILSYFFLIFFLLILLLIFILEATDKKSYKSKGLKRILQEISLVFLLISSYYAMVLTNWATIQVDTTLSSS